MTECLIQEVDIPEDLLGPLQEFTGDVTDRQALAKAVAHDGYVLLRDVLDRAAVMAAREEVMTRLHEVGEVAAPPRDGIAT
ncbi:MAG: hypothetical protein GY917_03700, partial [Planctomycetaceae bacterium]|nr:hypothetical protein [Planctomycetaceae bacterium]